MHSCAAFAPATVDRLVADLRASSVVVDPPAGSSRHRVLRELTGALLAAEGAAPGEYADYLAVRCRELDLARAEDELRAQYAGRRVLVTGGTGCIGSALIERLGGFDPAEIVSVSRSDSGREVVGARYLRADLRDPVTTRGVFDRVRPEVVFHCAAQRSPALAEREVAATVATNLGGTRHVLEASRALGVEIFVHASTGKAMRYTTGDVYAGTKKLAEWLVRAYAAQGRRAGMARFTHVVDNPVLLERMAQVEGDPAAVMRVHGAESEFFVQSAAEAAQLLLLAGGASDERATTLAVRDLGRPVNLLRLVLGRLAAESGERFPAINLVGADRGYERGNVPGLYDPFTATDLSPLINAVEADEAIHLAEVPGVDRFWPLLDPARAADVADAVLSALSQPSDRLAKALFLGVNAQAEALFERCPDELFGRLDHLARQADHRLPTTRAAAPRLPEHPSAEAGRARVEVKAR